MRILINASDQRWNDHKINFKWIAKNALILANKGSEVSITLTGDDEVRRLNKQYRGKDSPTNVLSFESGDEELLGDVFISFDAIMREAPDNFKAHAAHLAVHGVLHLQGFDHTSDSDAEKMERREVEILKKLGIANPYGEPTRPIPKHRVAAYWLAPLLFATGSAGAIGFAPMHWWPATAASIGAAYYFMTKGRSLFWWGAGYAVANFHWSLESIFANDQIAAALWWLYPIGLIGIALAGGAIFSLPFWMTRRTAMSGWRRTLLFALAWTFVLWLREWMLTGFPWNPLANILIDSGAASIMPIAGAIGMTFMVAGTIGSVPEFLITKAKWQFLFFVPLLLAAVWSPRDGDAAPRGLRVRLVQPAFDMNRKFDRAEMDENIKTLVDLSKNPTNPETGEPDMIVWPETAYPYAVNDSVKMPALGIPLVFGAVYYDGGRFYNAMILSDKDGGIMDKYFKSHLVPFGEYRPFGDIIPTPGQLSAGRGPKEMSLSGALFFPAICYEIVFSDSITRIPNPESRTAGFILNITNDAWFGKSWGPRQHLDMARRQAMETGLPVVRANYGGISAVIDSRGRILQSLPIGVRGTLDAEIPGPRKTSYRRIGLNGAMLAITLSCAAILILTRRHKRQSPRSQRPN